MYCIGKKFGKLTVIKLSRRTPKKYYVWCRCECGNEKEIATSDLISGRTKSCGCYAREILQKRTKNKRIVKLYYIWSSMKKRCFDTENKSYKNYGGRGISICDEWIIKKLGYKNFERWALNNGYKEGLSIERIDNDGNYCPENCKWIKISEQANNKRNNIFVYIKDKRFSLKQASNIYNINYDCVRRRLGLGWNIIKALTIPSRKNKK